MSSLLYIADPMCSWCYGFAPEFAGLVEGLGGIGVDLMVGGLRAYHRTPIDEAMRAELLAHWQRVAEASGMPFAAEHLLAPGFVYDTEPACRAVVTARAIAPAASFAVFHAIQHAFYAEGRDVTRGDVLAEVASRALTENGVQVTAEEFRARWESEEMALATVEDFSQTRRWGVDGFPTLILEREGRLDLITSGYVKLDTLVERLQAIVDAEPVAA